MAKSLDDVKRELRSRLEELRPLVDEYQQLQRAAEALGTPGDEPRRTRRATAPGGRRSAKRAGRGENKQAVFRVISERPGVSVGEIAQVTGIGNPLVYGVTRNGVSRGELEAVDLGGGRKGFKLAEADGSASGGKSLEEATAGIEDDAEPAPVGG
jgi:hypothetical protein